MIENTFRATTIALMDEWSRFAEMVGVDLFEVVDAIRMRPTHANMRTPGFGVGGYCLTKDPLFAKLAAERAVGPAGRVPVLDGRGAHQRRGARSRRSSSRPSCSAAAWPGGTSCCSGISYRQDVGDTRYSPSETFVRAAIDAGAEVVAHDPLVEHWDELDRRVADRAARPPTTSTPSCSPCRTPSYRDIDVATWLGDARPAVISTASDVLRPPSSDDCASSLGCRVASIGRGRRPRSSRTRPDARTKS